MLFTNKLTFLLAGSMTICAFSSDNLQDSTAMFTPSALENCDFDAVGNDIVSVMRESDAVLTKTTALIEKYKGENTLEIRAVAKRFEITLRLKSYIDRMNKGDAGQKLLA